MGQPAFDRGLFLVPVAESDDASLPQRSLEDSADGKAAEVIRCVEIRDQSLDRRLRVSRRCRNGVHDRIEQSGQVRTFVRDADPGDGPAHAGHRGDDWEVDVVILGIEVEEELIDLVGDFVRPGVGPVDLVDHHHRR